MDYVVSIEVKVRHNSVLSVLRTLGRAVRRNQDSDLHTFAISMESPGVVNCTQCRCRASSFERLKSVRYQVEDLMNLDGTPFRAEQLAEAEENVRLLQRQLTPPLGFIPYEPQTMPGWENAGVAEELRPTICPNCGDPLGGSVERRWEDDSARRAYEEAILNGIFISDPLDPVVLVDNQPILSHWSRVKVLTCVYCEAQTWHPMYGEMGHWYKPNFLIKAKAVQL